MPHKSECACEFCQIFRLGEQKRKLEARVTELEETCHALTYGGRGDPAAEVYYAEEKARNLKARVQEMEAMVADQADDEGLWFVALTAPEAYLQQALRKLHRAIERK